MGEAGAPFGRPQSLKEPFVRNPLHLVTYYDTYHYCNVVHNILGQQTAFLVTMNSLFEDERIIDFAAPWQKWTALHRFIAHCIHGLLSEDLTQCSDDPLKFGEHMSARFRNYGIDHLTMDEFLLEGQKNSSELDEDDAYEYLMELTLVGDGETLVDRIVDEVFFVMFSNRQALEGLNSWVSNYMSSVDLEDPWLKDSITAEALDVFAKSGRLKRVKPPRWVKEAVFFRDRGHCAQCGADLTRLSHVGADDHYDHIVPLASGGLNDVTNLQLLCSGCNLEKGSKIWPVSRLYERWFAVEDE